MALHPALWELCLRLALALVAGILFGLDRGEHGKAAGMRTTTLVCLAAAGIMVQVNLLLAVAGKPSDSFVQFDIMRLPLGLLSGMGFIGAGAIVRRPRMVEGVTTAATLWFVTIVGLCFGGGQLGLGAGLGVLGLAVLLILRAVENGMEQVHTGELWLRVKEGVEETAIREAIGGDCRIVIWAPGYANGKLHTLRATLRWKAKRPDGFPPPAVGELGHDSRIEALRWRAG